MIFLGKWRLLITLVQVCVLYDPREIERWVTEKYPEGLLGDSSELLTRADFIKTTRLTNMAEYQKDGLIAPKGLAKFKGRVFEAFHPDQEIPLLKNSELHYSIRSD